jgi:hypothetical protein
VLMRDLAMLVRRRRVALGLVMLVHRVMMFGLMVVMRGGVVMSGCLMMMFSSRMLRFCHFVSLPDLVVGYSMANGGLQCCEREEPRASQRRAILNFFGASSYAVRMQHLRDIRRWIGDCECQIRAGDRD